VLRFDRGFAARDTMTKSTDREAAAAIDLGTNTALLLVARLDERGALDVIEDHCRTPRLGAGVAARGALDRAAIERTLESLAFFAGRLRVLGVDASRTRAVGTAVLRRVSDARAFTELARERTGIDVEVLPASEEARLGALAVAAEGVGADTVVVDVGGGSTEVACSALDLHASVPIGAVVLTEAYLGGASANGERFAALNAAARDACAAFPAGIGASRAVVALGGTAVNLACLARGFERFDPARAEGSEIAASTARTFAEQLIELDVDARMRFPIEPERAAILPAGLACLAAVLERIEAARIRVTGRGLRFGVVRDLLARRRKK
jgi:exopolyphosphatase/guanosine-5'-triphosphate,3'-diphosphate pyrophosphatase